MGNRNVWGRLKMLAETLDILKKHNLSIAMTRKLLFYYENGYPEHIPANKFNLYLATVITYYDAFGGMLESEFEKIKDYLE